VDLLEPLFLLRVAISFVAASAVVASASVIAERYGPRRGGVIATLPSTLVVSTLFMGFNQGEAFVAEAAVQIPVMMGANSLFLALYVLAIPLGMWGAGLVALASWALIAAVFLTWPSPNVGFSVLLFTALTLGSFWWLNKKTPAHLPSIKIQYTPLQVAARGLLAGTVVASALVLARIGGPVWGGVFTPAPAIFLSTMWILHRSQGARFASSMARSMCLAGFIPMLYAVVVALSFVAFGMFWATLLAYGLAIPAAVAVSKILKRLAKPAVGEKQEAVAAAPPIAAK